MPPISKQKRDKISEQILSYLYHSYPQPKFTVDIARETARDEEFIKSLMKELESKRLVQSIKKNSSGINYLKRIRWVLTPRVYETYQGL
jgi:DNA-binding IscR family transcriptional regulator